VEDGVRLGWSAGARGGAGARAHGAQHRGEAHARDLRALQSSSLPHKRYARPCASTGAKQHKQHCVALDRVPRLCAACAADGLVNAADELESVLRSLAWQSPSLAAYMKPKLKREDECELLTADDMAELMADTNSSAPKRQKRSSDNLHTHADDAEGCAENRESAARSACVETGAPVSGGPLPAGPCSATRIQNRVAGPLGPVRDRSLTPLGGEPSGQALEGVAHRFQELTLQQQREASASS
jgi:hypothetical protein